MKKIFVIFSLCIYCSWLFSQTNVTVDFNARSGGTTVPVGMLGVNIAGLSSATPLYDLLPPASLVHTRLFVDINQNCPAGTCGTWSIPLGQLALLAAKGLKVTAVVFNTPSNLGASTCTPPSNTATWDGYVNTGLATFASHYPGTVDSVEIWNEPDGNVSWCPAGGAGNDLSTYKTFIATAGPAIKTANSSLQVGMPALASPGANTTAWFGAGGVIASWSTPDFISYHDYLASSWSTWASLLAATQNVSTGYGATLANIQTTLSGQGYNGPVWITEINDGYGFVAGDCCRYDNTYSILYNPMMVIDEMNVVNTSSGLALPSRINYYSDENTHYFCLFGNIAGGICADTPSPVAPYPNYYAYLLMGTMGIYNGGNLATSITPASTVSGVSCTAWYKAQDNVLCVNPTVSDDTSATITFSNTGFTPATAVQYLLNSSNGTVTSTVVALTHTSGTSYTATVTIPALTTIGFSLTSGTSTYSNGTFIRGTFQ